VTKIKSLRQARLKSLTPFRRKPRNHRLTDEPLTDGASQISTPRSGFVHALQAESLTPKPPEIGREPPPPPGVHRLKAAPPKPRRKRSSPNLQLIRTVLRQQVPEWGERLSIAPVADERLGWATIWVEAS
jgi:hypothetical protein